MVPPGFMVDTPWLRAQGIDPKSIHDYVARGWLERIVRGVYRRPLPEGVSASTSTSWETTLLSLQRIMNRHIYLGGESALERAGHGHYLRLGDLSPVHFYGESPAWLERLPANTKILVHRLTLFGDDNSGIDNASSEAEAVQSTTAWPWAIKASTPERAILEALDELPNHASWDNLDKIFESLTTLRPKQVSMMLSRCRRVKVRRLFFVFADRHQHAWRKHIDTSQIDFGSGPRALVPGGRLHPTYKIYVPQELLSRNRIELTTDA